MLQDYSLRKPSFYYFAGVLTVICVLVALYGFNLLLEFTFDSGNGEYNIISSTPSPDGKNIAIIYAGWGGGAAGWSFCRATIVPANEQFNPEQNYDYVFDVKGGRDVKTIWEGNNNLLITYVYKPEKTNSYLRVSKEIYSRHTGINVRYIEKTE